MRFDIHARILSGVSVTALAFAAVPAFAQSDAAPPATAAPAETAAPAVAQDESNEVVVTGSRIARPEFAAPSPVQAYNAETIEQSGDINVTEFLVDSPALLGSSTSSDNAGSNTTTTLTVGGNYLDLRNLGTNRTLVLVDGRRHVSGVPGSSAVDINSIPLDLIQRVDVLTGGASAVYGADAVTGVVNFIMKRDFEGLRLRGQSGISQRGDAAGKYIGVTAGKNFGDGRGNITGTYEYAKDDRFSQLQRLNYGRSGPTFRFVRNQADLGTPDNPNLPDNLPLRDLRWADTSPGGAFDLDYDFSPDFTGEGKVYDPGTYVARSSFTIGGDSTRQDIYFGDTNPANERQVATLMGSYEISPALRLFAEGKYALSRASTFQQPTYDLYVQIYQDNAYLTNRFGPQAGDVLLLGRDHFDFGIRNFKAERETIRSVIGAEGDLGGGLNYEVSYVFGQTKSNGTGSSRVRDRYYAAIDAVRNPANNQITCRINLPGQTRIKNFGYIATQQYGTFNPVTGNYEGPAVSFQPGQCVPLDIFGNGAPSQAALNFIFSDDPESARIRQHVVSGSIRGNTGSFLNLPGGPVAFAVGGEYRRESFSFTPSPLNAQGLLLDSSLSSASVGKYDVKEAFGEINLPIVSDGFIKTLSVGGAARYSDYSTIGNTFTWSVNGIFAPIQDISFRGTLGQAVRAPNLGELFNSPSGTYEFIADPCGIDRINDGTSTRAANCAAQLAAVGRTTVGFDPNGDPISPANTSLLGRTGGNLGLQEEKARTWTAGVVLRPRFIPNLQLAFDWYDIRIKQAINTPTAEKLVELCVDQPTLNNQYCTSIRRDPLTGYISDFLVTPANVANFKTAGLDVVLNYVLNTNSLGSFNVRLAGNYLHKIQFVPTPGAEVDNDLMESGLGSSLTRAPRYSGNADITWKMGDFFVNYGLSYFSKTLRYTREQTAAQPDITSPEFLYIKPRWEHDVQLGWDVDRRFNFYVGVNNLTDRKPDVGLSNYPYSSIGRSFYAGFKAKVF